jgi:hypothetical protein
MFVELHSTGKGRKIMKVHKLISDIKERINIKNMGMVNQKYIQPGWSLCKAATLKTCDFFSENTPKIIAVSKVGIHKIQAGIAKLSKKKDKGDKGPSK